MVTTLTLKMQIPSGRKLEIQLPDEVPEGPAEIALVVVTSQADAKPSGEPYAWGRYCLENAVEWGRSDLSSNIEDFTGRRF